MQVPLLDGRFDSCSSRVDAGAGFSLILSSPGRNDGHRWAYKPSNRQGRRFCFLFWFSSTLDPPRGADVHGCAHMPDDSYPIPRCRLLALLAVCVLLAWHSRVFAQIEQQQNPIFLDESPVASDALSRAREHLAGGNLDATADVLQRVLDDHPREVTPSGKDQLLSVSLRKAVEGMLISNPDLLERYRQRQASAAGEMLAQGRLEELARTRLLTTPGLEATLMLARREMLDGHFDASALRLGDLANHPDAGVKPGGVWEGRVLTLARELAPYLTSPARLVELAELVGEALPGVKMEVPASAQVQPSVLLPGVDLPPADLLPRPIGTGTFADLTPIQVNMGMTRQQAEMIPAYARALRLWPVLTGSSVILTSGPRIWSFDRLTARPRWTVDALAQCGKESVPARGLDPQAGTRTIPTTDWEESTSPALVSGTLVAVVAQDVDPITEGEEIIVGLDPQTGSARWCNGLSALSPDLARANARGPVLGDSGVALVSLVKEQRERRQRVALLAGVDALTGTLRWSLPVASTGVLPYAGTQRLADALAVDAGVVYRSDRIGVVGAYRVVDGEPLWVRHLPAPVQAMEASATLTPWAMMAPVVAGRSVFVLSPDRERIIELDAGSGGIIAERASAELGRPDYLLLVGEDLVGVGYNRLAVVPLAKWGIGQVVMSGIVPELGIRGRVGVAGGRLLVPTEKGVSVINPGSLRQPERWIALESPGTPLATGQGLIVVDDARVHVYSTWEIAALELRRQMSAMPDDPAPALELLSLAERSGRVEEFLPALEQAAGVVGRAQGVGRGGAAEVVRGQLIELVLSVAQRQPGAVPAGVVLEAGGVGRALAMIDPIALTPRERAAFLLVRSGVEQASDPVRAIADAHAVLDDPLLAGAPWSGKRGSSTAGAEARLRVVQIVAQTGRAGYGAFDEQFTRERAGLGAGASALEVERLAGRFPVALGVADMWLELAGRQGTDLAAQARSLELGLIAAGDIPDASPATVGRLSGMLVKNLMGRGLDAAAQDAISRALALGERGVVAMVDGVGLDLLSLQAELGARLSLGEALPAIGVPSVEREAQVLGGWALMEALIRQRDSSSARFVAMQHADGRRGLFGLPEGALAREAATGESVPLTALWMDEQPVVERSELFSIDARGVVYFVADAAGGRLVRVQPGVAGQGAVPGAPAWSTEPFGSLFPADPPLRFDQEGAQGRVNTPDAGARQVSELIGASDGQTMVLVERAGRAAGFDAQSGRVLWTARLTLGVVFEASLGPAGLVVGGAVQLGDARTPMLSWVDARSGRVRETWASTVGDVRWVRQSPAGDVFVGGSTGLEKMRGSDDGKMQEVWKLDGHPAAVGFDAWVHGGKLLVVTDEPSRALWRVDIGTGRPDEQGVDVRNKLETSAGIEVWPVGRGGFAVCSGRGVALVDGEGKLVGADVLEMGAEEQLVMPQRSAGGLVSIVASRAALPELGAPLVNTGYTLVVVDDKSARLTSATPIRLPALPQRLGVLPGRVVVTAGHATVVVPAPAK